MLNLVVYIATSGLESLIYVIHKYSPCRAVNTFYLGRENNYLILSKEIFAVCSQVRKEHINEEFVYVKSAGTQSYH